MGWKALFNAMYRLLITRLMLPAVVLFAGVQSAAVPAIAATSPLPLSLPGKSADAATQKDELTFDSIAGKREALKKEIAATRTELSKLSTGTTDESARWLTQEIALLERIDAVHAEQQRTL